MFKKLWTKLKSAFTFNVLQPFLFKMHLLIALLIAAAIPTLISTALTTSLPSIVVVGGAFIIFTGLIDSVMFLLESIAFRPDRYVSAQEFNQARSIVAMAEVHRKAMMDAVKKMKKSKAKHELSNILGIPEDQR